jgi:single-strand DNA-binding protein
MPVGLNRTQIIGYVGADPRSNDDQSVGQFSVGVTERWKDRSGENCEHTEWYRVVVFNCLASACERFLTRGGKVFVEGRLRTRGYTGKDGEERRTTELIASTVMFLDSRRAESDEAAPHPGKPQTNNHAGARF